jgi:hypothetical protein
VRDRWENLLRLVTLADDLAAARPEAGIADLVADLDARSPEFRGLWAAQGVGGLARAFKVFVHPEAGRIELTYQTFDVHDAPGQQLLVGTPVPGSPSEQALTFLAATTTR